MSYNRQKNILQWRMLLLRKGIFSAYNSPQKQLQKITHHSLHSPPCNLPPIWDLHLSASMQLTFPTQITKCRDPLLFPNINLPNLGPLLDPSPITGPGPSPGRGLGPQPNQRVTSLKKMISSFIKNMEIKKGKIRDTWILNT